MAVTKIMKIGTAATTSGKYLYNSINYILNPGKTEGGLYVGGNSGSEADEVYQTMIDTKKEWNKLDKRQGYHFVISFAPGEASAEQAYDVLKDFCEEYLGDDYDYVFSIHTDQEHMHGHIVFNSVSRTDGYKYRYEKGDWEKKIQPVTDKVCEKYGLPKLKYEEDKRKGKSYAEHFAEKNGKPTLKKIIQADIDYVIARSDSYKEFAEQMKILGYRMRFGKKVTYYVPGYERGARREDKLDAGYSTEEIKERIADKNIRHERTQVVSPKLLAAYDRGIRQVMPQKLTSYQSRRIEIFFRTGHFWDRKNPYAVNDADVRKSILHIEQMYEECVYILKNNIKSGDELSKRQKELERREEQIKGIRRTTYLMKEDETVRRYEELQSRLRKIPEQDDTFEELQEQMEKLEQELPAGFDELQKERRMLGEELSVIRNEKKILKRIQKSEEERKSQKKTVSQKTGGLFY